MATNSTTSSVAAILLAAGRSTRMGAFKPLLPFGSSTIIETCLDHIQSADVSPIVVVISHRADELRAKLIGRNVTFAINPDPESEMGISIAHGVRALPPEIEAVFIALVDQPAIPPEVYRILLRERDQTGAGVLVPQFNGHRGHPVLVDLGLCAELLQLDQNDGLRGFLDRHESDVRRIPLDCSYVVRDIDTPADYRELHVDVFGPDENV